MICPTIDFRFRFTPQFNERGAYLGMECTALAAGSRRAKTAKPVECEASQSGGEAATPKHSGSPSPSGAT